MSIGTRIYLYNHRTMTMDTPILLLYRPFYSYLSYVQIYATRLEYSTEFRDTNIRTKQIPKVGRYYIMENAGGAEFFLAKKCNRASRVSKNSNGARVLALTEESNSKCSNQQADTGQPMGFFFLAMRKVSSLLL